MIRSLLLAATLLAAPAVAAAGDLTPKAAGEVLDQLDKGLDTYIFPDIAKQAQASLKAHRAELLKLDTRDAFAAAVSKDLYGTTHDKHLKVSVQTLDAGREARLTEEQQALVDRRLAYGMSAVRRLPANVGYMKLSYLEQTDEGVRLVDTLMGLLKDTDALIIDLRDNHGGGGGSDEELVGHLFKTAAPMVKITWRNDDGTVVENQRLPSQPATGPLYADRPVYVLIDKHTFSAAEGLAYHLQATKRATIMGETSGGGANPQNRPVRLSYGLRVFIPNGHVVHPITHTNWEGVGVVPDVPTAPDRALTAAYALALKAAKPLVATPKSEKERADALADPKAALLADQAL
jgi:C-terminal processing protease CtpA/Prc